MPTAIMNGSGEAPTSAATTAAIEHPAEHHRAGRQEAGNRRRHDAGCQQQHHHDQDDDRPTRTAPERHAPAQRGRVVDDKHLRPAGGVLLPAPDPTGPLPRVPDGLLSSDHQRHERAAG
jgi:hypothetical protein